MVDADANIWYTITWYVMWIGHMILYIVPIGALIGYLISPDQVQPVFTDIMFGAMIGAPLYTLFIIITYSVAIIYWNDFNSIMKSTVVKELITFLSIQLTFIALLLV